MTANLYSLIWMLRRSRIGLAVLMLGIVAFEMIQPVAIKSFGDLDRLQPLLQYLPNSFWAMMNVTPDFLGSFGLAGYLSLGYTHPVYLILTSTTVVWFASRVLAGEMERGSIQFALSRPVSRVALYGSSVAAVLVVISAVSVVGPIGMLAGIELARPMGIFHRENLVVAGAATWLLIWAVAGITLFWSSLSSTMSRSIGLAIAVLVISYVIDYFAALWDALKPLQPFSIFAYYKPSSALASGEISLQNIVVLGLVGAIGAAAGLVIFVRRDLPV
jgi:ABC-type transport system involved in multi-copper enzyme maturation permease subunit